MQSQQYMCSALGDAKVNVGSNALSDALTVIAICNNQDLGQAQHFEEAFECPFWFYILLLYSYFTIYNWGS